MFPGNRYHAELRHFLDKPLMYIASKEKDCVVAFIVGFEVGAATDFSLIGKIKLFLEDSYAIFGGALGWPRQIEIYAEQKALTFFEALKELTEIVISPGYEGRNE